MWCVGGCPSTAKRWESRTSAVAGCAGLNPETVRIFEHGLRGACLGMALVVDVC